MYVTYAPFYTGHDVPGLKRCAMDSCICRHSFVMSFSTSRSNAARKKSHTSPSRLLRMPFVDAGTGCDPSAATLLERSMLTLVNSGARSTTDDDALSLLGIIILCGCIEL